MDKKSYESSQLMESIWYFDRWRSTLIVILFQASMFFSLKCYFLGCRWVAEWQSKEPVTCLFPKKRKNSGLIVIDACADWIPRRFRNPVTERRWECLYSEPNVCWTNLLSAAEYEHEHEVDCLWVAWVAFESFLNTCL